MLGSGDSPNIIPMQMASLFTICFSIGLFFLSKIEKRKHIRIFCVCLAILYAVMHLGALLPYEHRMFDLWFHSIYFLKILVGVTIGVVALGSVKSFQSEI